MIEFTICVWLLCSLFVYGLTNAIFYKIDGKNHRLFSLFMSLCGPLYLPACIGLLLFENVGNIEFKL